MNYDQEVGSRFHIYNSLFLNLPFRDISKTGTLLPLLQQVCEAGFEKGDNANDILLNFFKDFSPHSNKDEQFDLLFNFIKYVERQVALFDSIEDASFETVNDTNGKGTVAELLMRTRYDQKEDELKARLKDFGVRVVLTAHPTQFYPGHVLGILTDLEKSIRESDLAQINALLKQLGKTGFINKDKPSPYDEAVSLTWFLENTFYHAIPQIIEQLLSGLNIPVTEWQNNHLINIGFWPGGDRDGNPFVTSDTTVKVAARLRETILKNYYRDLRLLRRRLTFQGVLGSITEVERKVYQMAHEAMHHYASPEALVDDLLTIRKKLIDDHEGLFLDLLDTFILKVRVFGFHFASLDIRQDSRKHDHVWKTILNKLETQNKSIGWEAFLQLSEEKKANYLLQITANPVFLSLEDEFCEEAIKTVLSIPSIQKQNGPSSCHRYVISNCQSVVHVMEVYQLAKILLSPNAPLPLDIVPLFETIDDLAHAKDIMDKLYAVPEYREHLKSRQNKQTIMLGFSDGTKDGGYLRANWSIFRTKEELTNISRKHGIKALFFDGRGGPPARGGGNTHDFYASLGDTIENEEVQITIQGQTISSNFGKVTSCKYNLEQLLSAGLQGSVFKRSDNQLTHQDKELLDELATDGYEAYLKLKHHAKFIPYLEKVTPLAFFGDTNIGSRPVKRSGSDGLKFEDLRAIPFVGTWAMMKQNIPGFYGVGSAVSMLQQKGKTKQLQELYTRSLFFRTLLGNSMMSLTKSYYPATRYLSKDAEFGEFWTTMHKEYELSRSMVLNVAQMSELMQNNPSIKSSVRLRERIVLPLIAIQQFALMNLRNPQEQTKVYELRYRKLVIRCMFGIINAARNSA
jgi:phosphoenolpyruvate carboxylase